MPEPLWLIVAVVIAALIFDFTNGWNDAANSIATVVSTRVLTPLQAVSLAAVLNVIGAFASTAVAKTMGRDIVDPNAITQMAVLAALIGGIVWNTAMTLIGLPISASHALIGGLVGAAVAHGGWAIVQGSGIRLILIAMLVSPVLGGVAGFLLMKLLNGLFGATPPSVINKWFRKLQLVSVGFMSFSHGSADAQKVMGIITLALYAGGYATDFTVPIWVIISCAAMMGLGTMVGGWGVIKTLGMRMLKLEPIHGFAAETGSAILLQTAAGLGIPVSTTHTITGSILGVGASGRLSKVRWGIANKIIYAWVFTLPGSGLISYLVYQMLKLLI